MDVAVSTSLTFNNTNVALTAQGGGSFFANNPITYGSAFLLANLVIISGNSFDTLQVGGAAADSITGSDGIDWISGGEVKIANVSSVASPAPLASNTLIF